ncbi:retrovirus-related pol polyprotein from transposon TNT 1-94 [Tanacetum coccineum]
MGVLQIRLGEEALHPITDQSASSPVKIEAPQKLPKIEAAVQQYHVDKQCFEIQNKQFLIENNQLLDQIISQDIVNIVVNSFVDVNSSMEVNSSVVMNDFTYKQLYDSIKPLRVLAKEQTKSLVNQLNQKSVEITDLNAQLQEKVFVITALKHDLRKFKGKDIVDSTAQVSNATTIALGIYKLDPVILAPKLIQELLGYVRDTCLEIHKHRVNPSISASGSKPLGNTKNDRISQTPSSNEKNNVEVQSRKVKSSLNKWNSDSKNVCNEHVKHPVKVLRLFVLPYGDALKKCILEGPYTPSIVIIPVVLVMDNSLAVPKRTTVETVLNMSPENKAHFESEKEAIHLILTGTGDEIYPTIDACKTTHEMWEAIKRLQQEWLRFVTIVKKQHKLDEVSYHKLFDILKQYQKEVNELYAERIAKNANPLALVATAQPYQDPYYQAPKYHKSYALTSKASLPTRSHETTKNKGKEIVKPITPLSELAFEEGNDPEQAQKDKETQKNLALIAKNQRTITVARVRETIGGQVVQQPGIQCFNCKEFGHFAKECRKPKRVKDSMYHKEKMLLRKQAEKGVQLQVKQSDWLADTDEEIDEQELEAYYSYMAKIPERSEQPEYTSNTCLMEQDDSNVIPDSPDMYSKKVKKANKTLAHELTDCKYILVETSRTLGESNSIRDSCLVALQNKQTEFERSHDQSDPANRLVLDREETLTLEKESRSKLNKDLVKPYDYTKLNSLYEIFKSPTQEYQIQLAHANEVRKKMRRKSFVKTKPNIFKNINFLPVSKSISKSRQAYNVMTNNINHFRELVDQAWVKHSKDHFYAPTAHDMEILIKTCLMPLAIKTQNDSFTFVHELKQEMHADLKYVESLKNEIDELESDKAEFSNMYDILLQECVSNDVMCSYLHSLSYLDSPLNCNAISIIMARM